MLRSIICRNYSKFSGLPFKLNLQNAYKSIMNDTRFLERSLEPEKSLVVYKKSPITERFIPFYSAHIKNLASYATGEYGIDRTETYVYYVHNGKSLVPIIGTRTVTDWYNTTCNLKPIDYPLGLKNTQIYAGFKHNRSYVQSVLPTENTRNISKLPIEALYDEYKKKRIVEPHIMNSSYGLSLIVNSLYEMERERAINKIKKKYNANHVKINELEVKIDKATITLVSYHLPAFIYEMDKNLSKIINAYTGTIKGDHIYSPSKSFVIGSMTTAMATGLFIVTTTPTILLPIAILTTCTASLVGGVGTSIWAKYQHNVKAYFAEQENIKHAVSNSQFSESIEDSNLRNSANEFNGFIENESNTVSETTSKENDELYTILGLEPSKKNLFTKEEIKTAYLKQINKWHPDKYNGDKIIANGMTSRINEAYSILSK